MTPTDYFDVAMRILMLGLAIYAIVAYLLKPALRWVIRRKGWVTEVGLKRTRVAPRTAAVLLGMAFAAIPGTWPAWMPSVWLILCGIVAGSLSIGLHHAVEAALPDAIAKLLTGGSVSSGLVHDTITGDWVALPDEMKSDDV